MTKSEKKAIEKHLNEMRNQLQEMSYMLHELHMRSGNMTHAGKMLLDEHSGAGAAINIATGIKQKLDGFESEVLIQQTNLLSLQEQLLPGTRARREKEAEYRRQERQTETMEKYAGYSGT